MSSKSSAPSGDLRVRRTRKALTDALVALMEERAFEAITVREICERAMTHRATFYTHFTDKYDLLRSVLNGLQDDLMRIQGNMEGATQENPFHLQVLEYVIAHQALFTLLLVEREADSLTIMMRQRIAAMAEIYLRERERQGTRYRAPMAMIAQYFAGATFAVISWWLENDRPLAPEDLVLYLNDLLGNQYEA